jgi:hypothetical protein
MKFYVASYVDTGLDGLVRVRFGRTVEELRAKVADLDTWDVFAVDGRTLEHTLLDMRGAGLST